MNDERERWDRKYREGSHTDLTPDPFLLQAYENFIQPLLPKYGTVLDVAGGVGRHSIWLAERGWESLLIDISPVATDLATKHALERVSGMGIRVLSCDLDEMAPQPPYIETWRNKQYDLVLVFFYLNRSIFPALIESLKPGGLLLYKTYTSDHPKLSGGKGPSHPMHLLEHNELLHAFHALRILHYRESIQGKGVAELVAQANF